MRVALVGLGYWGAKLLRNLVTVVGSKNVLAIDQDRSRQEAMCQLFPAVSFADDLDEALRDETIEAVIVATPVGSHASLARRCLIADRHVMVEKPLADSVEDAFQLVQLAEERRRTLMVGHTFLFSPRLEAVNSAIQNGRIGRVHYMTSTRMNLGIYQQDANVIWDLAPHDFSIVFHLLGEYPSSIQTTARSLVKRNFPDVAFVNLTFPSGAIASVNVSWLAPKKARGIVVVGEQGMILYDDTHPDEPVKIFDRGIVTRESPSFGENQLTYRYGDTVSPYVPASEPLTFELVHFLTSAEFHSPCLSNGWFGLEVVKALAAADKSWQIGGHPVEVGDDTVEPAGRAV